MSDRTFDLYHDTGTQESGPTLKPGSWYIFIPTDPISNKKYVGKRCKVLRHTSYNTTYDCFAYAVEFEDKTTWNALEVELSKVVEEESDKP